MIGIGGGSDDDCFEENSVELPSVEQQLEEAREENEALREEVAILNYAIVLLKNRLVENNIDISDLMPAPQIDPYHMSKEELIAANKKTTERVKHKVDSYDKLPMPTNEAINKMVTDRYQDGSKEDAIARVILHVAKQGIEEK